jgi:hypothetical protein
MRLDLARRRRYRGNRRRARKAQQEALRLGDFSEDVWPKLAEDLAARSFCLDDTGGLETADVPRDERLAEADRFDQLADRGRTFRQALDHAQTVYVRQGLVEYAELA